MSSELVVCGHIYLHNFDKGVRDKKTTVVSKLVLPIMPTIFIRVLASALFHTYIHVYHILFDKVGLKMATLGLVWYGKPNVAEFKNPNWLHSNKIMCYQGQERF